MFCANMLSISMDVGFGPPARSPLLARPSPDVRRHRGVCAKKRVVFADSKGLALTSVRLFSKKEEKFREETPVCLKLKSVRWTVARATEAPVLRVGFPQPCANPQAFAERARHSPVLLESCRVAERALVGTVRVWNLSYEKAVHVRVTFDSWRSHQDLACAFLERRCGEPEADAFAFHVTLPERVEARERVEFCVRYLPQGHEQVLWDNNDGRNYSLHVQHRD